MDQRTMNKMWLAVCCLIAIQSPATAQNISAQISSQEAYVGQPVLLQVLIVNAGTHTPPELPAIDGLEIEPTGPPQKSSQISILNGRRSQRIVLMYVLQITPRREGTFTIPPIEIEVDGKLQTTKQLRFVATKSETGDLMFVEIDADDERVFVGQPIKLKLKIWIRPYQDREHGIKLSDAQMWQLVAANSNWGTFQDRIDELATENRRPTGEEVLREDSEGIARGYYLYEIESTIYPQRPGQVEIEDVQVVANYPTAIGQTRRRVSSMFGDDDFFGGSLFEDIFRDSPFNRRPTLTVQSARPIAEKAELPPVEVVEVPTAGRPVDYRGAVGKYRIGVKAEPTTVNAGDPITLQIVLQGDGPMQLVEAPPIALVEDFSKNFKVAEDSLAGFVQDDAKLFNTTLRPRAEGIPEIPPIPFSFFNPETEKYETTYSNAIPITVKQADSLSLDAIVGNSTDSRKQNSNSVDKAADSTRPRSGPSFINYDADEVLSSDVRPASFPWLAFALAPIGFCICYLTRHRKSLSRLFRSLKDPRSKAIAGIRQAQTPGDIINAIGSARSDRLIEVLAKCNASAYSLGTSESVEQLKSAAIDAMREYAKQDTRAAASGNPKRTAAAVLLIAFLAISVDETSASQPVTLTAEQQRTLLTEANAAYEQAQSSDGDQAESKVWLANAIQKYKLIADSGLRSSKLHFNLGNAYLRVGRPGNAIACFEQALRFAPQDRTSKINRNYAREQLDSKHSVGTTSSLQIIRTDIQEINSSIPRKPIWGVAIIAWSTIWLLPAIGLFTGRNNLVRPVVACSLVIFLLAAASLWISVLEDSSFDAVTIGEAVELHEGDSDQFPISGNVPVGERVKLLEDRGSWVKVKCTMSKQEGWLPREQLYVLRS